MSDTYQDKLRRMSAHFIYVGLYTKANYCIEISEYIDRLERFQEQAFVAHPNIDLDIEAVERF